MSRYFSLNVWTPYLSRSCGDAWVLGLNFDWSFAFGITMPYLSVTVYLLGFGACLTVWPRGKA